MIICARFPHQNNKRVLECLQTELRIANSAREEIVTIQLYCETLDQCLYYFDHGAPAIAPKCIVSLIELIASSIARVLNFLLASFAENRRRCFAGNDNTAFPQHAILYTCQEDVRESGLARRS
ncbi:vacuolar protein sorting-associated protein 35-domain-containing protein [Pisolithus microcarpus]|nr:vacuolar protein sorting-associated protein 35-domain-containing protein [Pisolithus microcarpus]